MGVHMGTSKSIFLLALVLMIFYGCEGPQGPMGPSGPAGQGIGSLSDPSIMPKVIYTYPPANSVGPYENFYQPVGWIYYPWENRIYPFQVYISQFQIRFNKFMDITSMRHAVAIASPLDDVRVDTSSVMSVGGDVFLVTPVDSNGGRLSKWRIGQNYTFTVSSVARDVNGNMLQPAFSMAFMPEPYFRVRAVSPANGATNVSPTNYYITLALNSTVDTSFHSFVQMNPPITGQWFLSTDSITLYYVSSPALRTSTTYTITIGTEAHNKFGNHLQQPFISAFTTLPFEVASTYPSDGSTNVGVMQSISINFTGQPDTSTVRAALTAHPPIAGQYYYYSPATVQLNPMGEMFLDSVYAVTIDTSIRGYDGGRLSAPYTFSFRTVPFEVSSTYPYDGSTFVSPYSSVGVFFNALIDTGSVRSSFSLLDSLNHSLSGYYTMYSNGFYFSASADLKPYSVYTAKITTGLRANQGKVLKVPYMFSFTTGSLSNQTQ